MDRKTKLGLSGIVFGLSTFYGINSFYNLRDVKSKLMMNQEYRESVRFRDANSKINSAEYKLTYSPSRLVSHKIGKTTTYTRSPEKNPDPKDAKDLINASIRKVSDRNDLCERLAEINGSLPNENNIKNYNGKRVDNSTFMRQRKSLESVSKNVSLLEKGHMDRVPKNLKDRRRNSILMLIGAVIAGIISSGYGLISYWNRD